MGEVSDLIGRTIAGRFVIEHHIGGGAMGEVFRARHVTLDSVVALKIMRPDIAKDEMYQKRFYREAKAASRLEHANSVRVLDFGKEPDGLLYLAMEYLSGRDLLGLIREQWPIADERVVDILSQTLSAVAGAHAMGIVHRDLKPENIMIDSQDDDDGKPRDVVKVCDFGIAKTTDQRALGKDTTGKALTTGGMLIGTPEYMSPEQARGDPLDARSDLYSVGVVLYQLLTGRVPFTAENAIGIALKQITDEPDAPEKRRPGVNPRLSAICMRAMMKNRDERYQTAKEMRADLRAVFGYRSHAVSTSDDSSGSGMIALRSDPEMQNAPTISAADGIASKRTITSDGTEISIPVTSTRRAVAGVLAVIAVIAAIVVVFVMSSRSTTSGGGEAPAESASTSASASATPSVTVVATTNATPSASARSVDRSRAVPTSMTRTSSTSPATAATSSASAAPSATAAPPATASGPPYNPAAANVALLGLTTERVAKDAVRAKMVSLAPRLTECYQMSLRMLGAPVAGSAEIHVSIDPAGKWQAFVNAPKHPEFARCAQAIVGAQSVPSSAVESGGGNATQWLALNP
jgi:serine/threonine-protein kinase